MNSATTLKSPAPPNFRLALDRACLVLMECAARSAAGARKVYRVTAARLAAKRQTARESGLSVEGRVNLGPKKSLLLVHCHGRRYLIASAGDRIAPIVEVLPVSSRKPPSAARKRTPAPAQPGEPEKKGRTQ